MQGFPGDLSFAESCVDQGSFPNKLQFKWDFLGIRAIGIGLSNGDFVEYGKSQPGENNGDATFEWNALQDPITELKVWDVVHHGIGGIGIRTKSGKTFEAVADDLQTKIHTS
jgi:hypothetical protein